MPIKIGDKTFKQFSSAVAYIMKTKGLTRERAEAYVATIERKQQPK